MTRPDEKFCPKCETTKHWWWFSENKKAKDKLASWCASCQKTRFQGYAKKRRANLGPEVSNAKAKAATARHKEKFIAEHGEDAWKEKTGRQSAASSKRRAELKSAVAHRMEQRRIERNGR